MNVEPSIQNRQLTKFLMRVFVLKFRLPITNSLGEGLVNHHHLEVLVIDHQNCVHGFNSHKHPFIYTLVTKELLVYI